VTDQSIYDWEEVNFAAPNFIKKKADIYQVELEQWLIKGREHQLALQAGILREDVTTTSRAFIGASDGAPPVIQLDINEKAAGWNSESLLSAPVFRRFGNADIPPSRAE
jgi:hypothetical protein